METLNKTVDAIIRVWVKYQLIVNDLATISANAHISWVLINISTAAVSVDVHINRHARILDQYFAMSVDTIDQYSADGTCSKHNP